MVMDVRAKDEDFRALMVRVARFDANHRDCCHLTEMSNTKNFQDQMHFLPTTMNCHSMTMALSLLRNFVRYSMELDQADEPMHQELVRKAMHLKSARRALMDDDLTLNARSLNLDVSQMMLAPSSSMSEVVKCVAIVLRAMEELTAANYYYFLANPDLVLFASHPTVVRHFVLPAMPTRTNLMDISHLADKLKSS
jgi:hypothetical protein